jgi:hypothetical protein
MGWLMSRMRDSEGQSRPPWPYKITVMKGSLVQRTRGSWVDAIPSPIDMDRETFAAFEKEHGWAGAAGGGISDE